MYSNQEVTLINTFTIVYNFLFLFILQLLRLDIIKIRPCMTLFREEFAPSQIWRMEIKTCGAWLWYGWQ